MAAGGAQQPDTDKEIIRFSKHFPNYLSNWILDSNKSYNEAVEEEKIFGYNWFIKINLINIIACFIILFILYFFFL